MNLSEQAQKVVLTLFILGIMFLLLLVMFQAGLLIQLTKSTCSTSAQMKQVFVSQLAGTAGASALAGAAAGSVVPGVGTAAGAAAGAILGAGIGQFVVSRIVVAFPLLCPPQELGTVKNVPTTASKLAVDCWEQYGSGTYDPLVGKQPVSKCYGFQYEKLDDESWTMQDFYKAYHGENDYEPTYPNKDKTFTELLSTERVLICKDYNEPTLCPDMTDETEISNDLLNKGKVYVSYYDSAASTKDWETSGYCNNAVIKNEDRTPLDSVVVCVKEEPE